LKKAQLKNEGEHFKDEAVQAKKYGDMMRGAWFRSDLST